MTTAVTAIGGVETGNSVSRLKGALGQYSDSRSVIRGRGGRGQNINA
jgi:hypothetical protein